IFLNAACLNSNLILLNSTSSRFPNGLGNDNGLLGKYMAFHNYRASANGIYPGFEDQYVFGRNPTSPIMANYRNLHKRDTDYLGGFVTFVWSHRNANAFDRGTEGIGSSLKQNLTEPGPWMTGMYMQGETIPRESNHVRLSKDLKDEWGIPQLITSIDY